MTDLSCIVVPIVKATKEGVENMKTLDSLESQPRTNTQVDPSSNDIGLESRLILLEKKFPEQRRLKEMQLVSTT